MSEDNLEAFSGFMPMISQINLTQEIPMLNTEGELVKAHTFKITTRDGTDYVFSIENYDLMKLSFLITKIISSS